MGHKKEIINKLLDVIFPSNIYCICCGALIEPNRPYSLCDKCMGQIHWITDKSCDICGKDLGKDYGGSICYNCMARSHKFTRGISCMTYGLYERQMILDYKYNGKGYMGLIFGEILADKFNSEDMRADIIIPVPIHKTREKKRGYNQSGIMAKKLGELINVPVRENGCIRSKKTELLRSMDPVERDLVMEDAFKVPEFEKKFIAGKTVLVVDDIITTGATLDACAKAILDGGALRVNVITLAAGPNRKPTDN